MRRLLALIAVPLLACSSAAPSIDPARSVVESTSPRTGDCAQQAQRPYFEYQVEAAARWLADSTLAGPGTWRPTQGSVRGDTVTVQFIVDTQGRPEAGTFRVLRAPSPQVGVDVITQIPGWRYLPARLGGCAVRQLVQTNAVRG